MKNFPVRRLLPALALAFWTLALVLIFNTNFDVLTTTSGQMGANDVAAIVDGFRQTPHFWSDFWRWWHGPWIQSGVQVFRPLASMMLWWECYVGLHYGFVYVAWWGVFLVFVACELSVCIAWRITKSWGCAWITATILPLLRFWNWAGTTPKSWAAWMPVHHDLLMIIGLLTAFLMWNEWLENGRRRYLSGCYLALLAGVLTKEYVYIFPLIALIWGLSAPVKAVPRALMLRAVGAMFVFIAVLFAYRRAVLPAPYNPPPLHWIHLERRPFLYWFGPFYNFVLTGTWWPVAQVFTLMILIWAWLRAWQNKTRVWSALPTFAAILASLALLSLIVWPFGEPVFEGFWYFLDSQKWSHLYQSLTMLLTAWAIWLVFKYRREAPTLGALGILLTIYLPVFTYLGWHYTLTGAFVRGAIWWPLVASLVARDVRGWLPAK